MLRVTPIYGSHGHHPTSSSLSLPPLSTLIEYGGVRVLIDVGWDESCYSPSSSPAPVTTMSRRHHHRHSHHRHIQRQRLEQQQQVTKLPPDLDAILVCNSTLSSVGGLPLHLGRGARAAAAAAAASAASASLSAESHGSRRRQSSGGGTSHQGRKQGGIDTTATAQQPPGEESVKLPPVYGTFPTAKMGQMALYDLHANACLDGPFRPGWDLDDVDDVFSPRNFNTLKYSQTLVLKDPVTGRDALAVTPHRSGHVVGGCFWVLRRVQDETEVVVCQGSYNHARERHLDACQLSEYAAAADVLVTRPGGPGGRLGRLYSTVGSIGRPILQTQPWSQTERELVECTMSALRRGGHVLLPVDASGRVLELLLLFASHWTKHRLGTTYRLVWVGPMCTNVVEYARSQLEWMAAPLGKQFDSQRGHPYALGGVVTVCGGAAEVEDLEEDGLPMAVLASGASLDHGPARDLLLRWADNPDNAIILTDSQRCVPRASWRTPVGGGSVHVDDVEDGGGMAAGTTATSGSTAASSRELRRSGSVGLVAAGSSSTVVGELRRSGSLGGELRRGSSLGVSAASSKLARQPSLSAAAAPPAAGDGGAAAAAAAAGVADPDAAVDANASIAVGSALSPAETSPFSTAAQLLLRWCEAKAAREEMPDEITVDVLVPHRAPLAGHELAEFRAEEEERVREEKAREERMALLREVELARGRLRLGDDDLADADVAVVGGGGAATSGGKGGAASSTSSASAPTSAKIEGASGATPSTGRGGAGGGGGGGGTSPRKKGRFDSNLFLKFSKPRYMTFDVQEEAVGIGQSDSVAKFGVGESVGAGGEVLEDEYGIAVIPERFHDIVTGIDHTKGRIGDGRDDLFHRRGLGFGSDGRPVLGGGAGGAALAAAAGVSSSAGAGVDKSEGDAAGVGEGGDDDADQEEREQALEVADLSEGRGIIRGRRGRPPIKVSTVPRSLEVLAEVTYIPVEGRVNARAARQMVRALQPRQVVILGGGRPPANAAIAIGSNEDDAHDPAVITDDEDRIFGADAGRDRSKAGAVIGGEAGLLADAIREVTVGGSIFAPADGETVELSVGHAAYPARLIDAPYVSREERSRLGDAEVASLLEQQLVGDLPEVKVGQYTVSLVEMVATGQKVASDGSIVLAPRPVMAESGRKRRNNVLLSDGEVLLTDLRSEMIAQGMKAEYSTHSGYQQLVVNGKVVVRKDQATGKIDVEGPLCEDFFTVRSIVCSQYTTL